MNMKTILKSSVAAAALMAVTAPVMAQSNIESGNAKVKLKIYGHVNKAMLWGDDGNNSRTFVVDNAASATRFGFIATAPVNADFSFGAQIETEFKSNSSGAGSAPQPGTTGVAISNANSANAGLTANDTNTGDTSFVERVAEVTMDHKRFGKVSLGNGGEAGDGQTEYNMGGGVTNFTGALGLGALGATTLFDKTNNRYYRATLKTTTAAAGITNASGISLGDGNRDDRVMYATPRLMGFRGQTSFSSGGTGAVSLDLDNKYGAFKVQAGVGYTNYAGRSASGQDAVSGSIAVLHDSGINASIAAAHRRNKKNVGTQASTSGDNTEYHDTGNSNSVGGTLGYLAKIFGVGPTGFQADYYTIANGRVQGSSVDTFAFGINQEFTDIGTDVYLGYRNFNHDIGNREKTTYSVGDIDDVNIVMTGVRVKF